MESILIDWHHEDWKQVYMCSLLSNVDGKHVILKQTSGALQPDTKMLGGGQASLSPHLD